MMAVYGCLSNWKQSQLFLPAAAKRGEEAIAKSGLLESALLCPLASVALAAMTFTTDSNCNSARMNTSGCKAVLCLPTPP